ncbi:MAG: MBL fold metallo-hydrolase [Planctomycetota bacterium]|nr:MAG: MBL fold metallo-hydrolase [Planctomycetota bacterium]
MASPARLIVLGSGSAVPRAERGTSCYLVDDGAGDVLLVDLGPGALQRAASAGYPLERISGVLLTHVHPDHCADLVHLLFALRSPSVPQRVPSLRVVGHPEVALLMSRLRNAWRGWLASPGEGHRVHVAGPGASFEFGSTRARAFDVEHHSSSLGWRLTLPDGFELAFSGDAIEGAQLADLGAHADLFVLEGAVPEARPFGRHLTPRRAARLARDCAARALLLTHFYPETDREDVAAAVSDTFSAAWALAADGQQISLRAPLPRDFAAPLSPR